MACWLRIRNYIIATVQFTILADISNVTLSNAGTVALKALDFVSGIDASYVHQQRVPVVSQAIANLARILDQAVKYQNLYSYTVSAAYTVADLHVMYSESPSMISSLKKYVNEKAGPSV